MIRKRKEAGKEEGKRGEERNGKGSGERIHKMGEVSSLTQRLKCAIRHKSEAKAPINSIQKTPGRKTRVVAATSNQTGKTVVIILHCVEICDNVGNAVVQFVSNLPVDKLHGLGSLSSQLSRNDDLEREKAELEKANYSLNITKSLVKSVLLI